MTIHIDDLWYNFSVQFPSQRFEETDWSEQVGTLTLSFGLGSGSIRFLECRRGAVRSSICESGFNSFEGLLLSDQLLTSYVRKFGPRTVLSRSASRKLADNWSRKVRWAKTKLLKNWFPALCFSPTTPGQEVEERNAEG